MERFRRKITARFRIKGEKTQSSVRKKMEETGRPEGFTRVTKLSSYEETVGMYRKLYLILDIGNLITAILSFHTIMHFYIRTLKFLSTVVIFFN